MLNSIGKLLQKNAMVGGAVTGALVSAVNNHHRQNVVKNASPEEPSQRPPSFSPTSPHDYIILENFARFAAHYNASCHLYIT
jgi:hypothetical protein